MSSWFQLRTVVVVLVLGAVATLGCGDDNKEPPEATPTATVPQATATATATPSPEDEVSQAYLRYWEVYSDAVFNLDESELQEVMTGPELERTLREIDMLRQRGRAAKIDVEHNFIIVELDAVAGTASIHDDYANRSYEVDAETKEIVGEPAPGTVLSDTYFLAKEGGTWKVRDGIRQTQ